MIRNLLILPDGTEVFSGTPGQNAIRQVTLTQQVGDGGDLVPGAVCAAMAEVDLFVPGTCPIRAGDSFTLCHVTEDGTRTQVGVFLAQKPEVTGPMSCSVTGVDHVSLLDRDLGQWLASLTGWPYTLWELAGMVCAQCGLALEETDLPGGTFPVEAFGGQGITGRQILSWIGQLAGRFCRATPAGTLEFAWYKANPLVLGPSGEHFYYQGSLRLADYRVEPIGKVRLRGTDKDVGAIYPDTAQDVNTLDLTGNCLLSGAGAEALEEVARRLYEQLQEITYTPGTLAVPAELPVAAGDVVTVTRDGTACSLYIMSRVQTGSRAELESTGSRLRSTTALTNTARYKAYTGRVLELELSLEGLKAENKNAAGDRASLALELEGIRAEVARQENQAQGLRSALTAVEQTAAGVRIGVETLLQEGAGKLKTAMGYTFDDTGLHIAKEGDAVSTVIDHTGMQVSRSGANVLQATAAGVKAIDITVENYLHLGSHARLEDFEDSRTACFYI